MLSKAERETIIVWNEEEKTAQVFTYSAKWKAELNELVKSNPKDYKKIDAQTFIVPKKAITIKRLKNDTKRND